MRPKLFDLAVKIAGLSTCNNQHGVVIAKGHRVIAVGTNSQKTHPLAKGPRRGIHAELAAIIASDSSVRGSTLYSARKLKNGQPGNSKPCVHCQELIEAFQIGKVVYHDGQQIVSMSV